MATTNPVTQVLAPTGNQVPLTIGQGVGALAVGQIGIFNYHTGLSVDGTVPANCRDIFIAVGVSRSGGVTLEDIQRSAGQYIPASRLPKAITLAGYKTALPKIVEITGFDATCETDYALKIEVRSQQSYGINGFNQFANTYNFRTGCCAQEDCTTCPEGDCNELALGMVTNINADTEALVTASLFANILNATFTGDPSADGNLVVTVGTETFTVAILNADTLIQAVAKITAAINATTTSAYTASNTGAVLSVYPKKSKTAPTALISMPTANGVTAGTFTVSNVTITDLPAFIAAHPGVCASIRITANAAAATPFNGNIPLKYYSSTTQNIIVTAVEGFTCNGTVTTAQELRNVDGDGRELAWQEYVAGGQNGKPGPYRTSSVNGLQKGDYDTFISTTGTYNQFILAYDLESVGGWLEYKNNLQIIIAVPCADEATLDGLAAIFDLIFTQFGAMTGDAAALDCVNVATNVINDYALDGIESLA